MACSFMQLAMLQFETRLQKCIKMWINVIRIFIWSHVTVRLNFRPYIQRYTSPNENFEYSYPLGRKLVVYHSHVWPLSVAPKYTYGQAHKILVVLSHMHAMKAPLRQVCIHRVSQELNSSSPARYLHIYGPRLLRFANNKDADQPAHPHSLISVFVFCFLEIIISRLATSEISIY